MDLLAIITNSLRMITKLARQGDLVFVDYKNETKRMGYKIKLVVRTSQGKSWFPFIRILCIDDVFSGCNDDLGINHDGCSVIIM